MSKKTRRTSKNAGKRPSRKSETHYGRAFGAAMNRPSEREMGRAFAAAMNRPSERAIGAAFGAAMAAGFNSSGKMKSPKRKLSAAEKAARKRVQSAIRSSAARAARLPGKKRRSSGKKTRSTAPATRRASSKKPRTVSASQVIAAAATKALKTWACQGPRRSGCGSGTARVVNAKGSFVRIRPPRVMTSG